MLHLSYLTLWNVLFRDYSDDLLIVFDVSQHNETNLVTENNRHDTRTEENDNDSVYETLQLLPNLTVIEVLFRWFYGYLLIVGIFPFFGGVCR